MDSGSDWVRVAEAALTFTAALFSFLTVFPFKRLCSFFKKLRTGIQAYGSTSGLIKKLLDVTGNSGFYLSKKARRLIKDNKKNATLLLLLPFETVGIKKRANCHIDCNVTF